jgi:plastocyanin
VLKSPLFSLAVIACSLVAAPGLACRGGGDDSPPDPTRIAERSVASASDRAAADLVVVADNLRYDVDHLTAPAGEVTVLLDNIDSGLPHNIVFYRGDDAGGDEIGRTDLNSGPAADLLMLQVEPGEYFYHCMVHPNMKGTLIAQ